MPIQGNMHILIISNKINKMQLEIRENFHFMPTRPMGVGN